MSGVHPNAIFRWGASCEVPIHCLDIRELMLYMFISEDYFFSSIYSYIKRINSTASISRTYCFFSNDHEIRNVKGLLTIAPLSIFFILLYINANVKDIHF